MQLHVEFSGGSNTACSLTGGGGDLAAFLSFVAMRGFGATHPLIALADRLHTQHRVSLGPFTTFYEAEADDREDRQRLEQAWQPAQELLETAAQVLVALESDAVCATLVARAGTPSLRQNLVELRDGLQALDPATLVRLTYTL